MRSHDNCVRTHVISAVFRQSRRIFAYMDHKSISDVALRAQGLITHWELEPQHLGQNRDATSRDTHCHSA